MLNALVIISVLLSLGFAVPATRVESLVSIWDVGFLGSVLTFLVLFVRLLMQTARQRIDDPGVW